jgi:hypothetical protein
MPANPVLQTDTTGRHGDRGNAFFTFWQHCSSLQVLFDKSAISQCGRRRTWVGFRHREIRRQDHLR